MPFTLKKSKAAAEFRDCFNQVIFGNTGRKAGAQAIPGDFLCPMWPSSPTAFVFRWHIAALINAAGTTDKLYSLCSL